MHAVSLVTGAIFFKNSVPASHALKVLSSFKMAMTFKFPNLILTPLYN
jgi:hypothetical protein